MAAASWRMEPVEYVVVIEGDVFGLTGESTGLWDYEERQVVRWSLRKGSSVVYENRVDLIERAPADALTQAAYFIERLYQENAPAAAQGRTYEVFTDDRQRYLSRRPEYDELVSEILRVMDLSTYSVPGLELTTEDLALTLRIEPSYVERGLNALTARKVISRSEAAPGQFKYGIADFVKADELRLRSPGRSLSPGSSQGRPPEYDVALSFAGEDREVARQIADALGSRSIAVFYDQYEQATLWGKNLYDHLSDLYENRASFCVILCSISYSQKLWTNKERQSAQARAFREHREYILPLRIDDTAIPGIEDTVAYLRLSDVGIDGVVEAIVEKVRQYRGK